MSAGSTPVAVSCVLSLPGSNSAADGITVGYAVPSITWGDLGADEQAARITAAVQASTPRAHEGSRRHSLMFKVCATASTEARAPV
jgi:hypothetical protein